MMVHDLSSERGSGTEASVFQEIRQKTRRWPGRPLIKSCVCVASRTGKRRPHFATLGKTYELSNLRCRLKSGFVLTNQQADGPSTCYVRIRNLIIHLSRTVNNEGGQFPGEILRLFGKPNGCIPLKSGQDVILI